jgi:hypothetical protein
MIINENLKDKKIKGRKSILFLFNKSKKDYFYDFNLTEYKIIKYLSIISYYNIKSYKGLCSIQ